MNNAGPSGSIDVDKFQRAMLIYRNSIDPESKASPALILFGRAIRDPIPIVMGRYCPHETWQETKFNREKAMAKRHSREHEKWSEHTNVMPPLRVGDYVYVQNLVGNHPKRWERTGIVVEVRQYHQYVVKVDGSGRVTLRNRQHLRKFTPFNKPSQDDLISQHVLVIPPVMSTPTSQPSSPRNESPSPNGNTYEDMLANDSPVTHPPKTVSSSPPLLTSENPEPNPDIVTSRSVTLPPAKKIPLALARLMPHNEQGIAENSRPRRLSGRRHK